MDALQKSSTYTEPTYVEDAEQEIKGIPKYKKAISYIEYEIYTTLYYLNKQLDVIDVQTTPQGGDDLLTPAPFNKFVYESKKQIVEQKLIALRLLATVASEQIKVTDKSQGQEVADISQLFTNQ